MAAQKIIHDLLSLSQKSVPAIKADKIIAQDLQDTLLAHQGDAAGLAANMIGQNKCIIAFFIGVLPMVMINPKIISKKDPYMATEGCLSIPGQKTIQRFEEITVSYQNMNFEENTQTFTGFVAETIQHEVDHCNGILV